MLVGRNNKANILAIIIKKNRSQANILSFLPKTSSEMQDELKTKFRAKREEIPKSIEDLL